MQKRRIKELTLVNFRKHKHGGEFGVGVLRHVGRIHVDPKLGAVRSRHVVVTLLDKHCEKGPMVVVMMGV